MIDRLRTEEFDVLVVGGGITGVGVALDAAARGLRTALVEADDFAVGTSSKSSKLVHGGLRYLQNGDIRLVYQALRERQRLRRNAPHLVRILPFLIPLTTGDAIIHRRAARALGLAMWGYDLTGGWRIGKFHRRLDADAAHAHMPSIPRDRLAGAYLYYDATVDDARLVLTVARTAAAHGAAVANRCRVVEFLSDDDEHVGGARVDTGETTIDVTAKVVVNATGVWADDLHRLEARASDDDPGELEPTIRPAKGVHVSVPWELVRNDIAAVVPVPDSKRTLFVVPWGQRPDGTYARTYIGTTDTDYDDRLDDPPCTADDIEYVLGAVNATIAEPIAADDLTGVWAGLRPLVRSADSGRTADLSRQHRVSVGSGGVVAIGGGKLTTYREMAEDTVDVVAERLGDEPSSWWGRVTDRITRWRHRRGTRSLPLLGAADFHEQTPGTTAAHLADRYGDRADEVEALIADDPALGEALVEGLPYLRAEAVYAVRNEMASSLEDVVCRRTRAHLYDRAATVAAAPAIADLVASELGWDDAERQRQLDDYLALVAQEQRDAESR